MSIRFEGNAQQKGLNLGNGRKQTPICSGNAEHSSPGSPMAALSSRGGTLIQRVVFRVDEFKAKRPNRRHLRDVVAGLRPMEV